MAFMPDPAYMIKSKMTTFRRRRYILALIVLACLYCVLLFDVMFLRTCHNEDLRSQTEYRSDLSPVDRSDEFSVVTVKPGSKHEERFNRRRETLQQQCKNKTYVSVYTDFDLKSHIIVNEDYHLAYCYIEKVGCTFWQRVFQILNGFMKVNDPYQTHGLDAYFGVKTLYNVTSFSMHHILKHSKTFLFVRDPYERLLSGYVDKMFLPMATYWLSLGKHIIEKFRDNTNNTNNSVEICGDDVTFKEFVRYFIYSRKNGEWIDPHFSSNFDHCRPCDIEYDFIGKLETFKEDTLFLLEKLGLNETVKITDFENASEKDAIEQAIDWCFYSWEGLEKLEKCIPISERIFRTYRMLQIRGLISRDIPFPFSNEDVLKIDRRNCTEIFLDIHARSGPADLRKGNRQDALMEAFSTLPQEMLEQLQDVLRADVELFGYDTLPESIKGSRTYSPSFRFFDGRR